MARRFEQLPGPPGLPLLGNALQVRPSSLHRTLEQWADRYDCPYRFRLGNQRGMVINQPELINEALHDRPQRFRRFAALEAMAEELGIHGLFSSEGQNWQRHRRAWMQALSVHHVKPFFHQLGEITTRLQRRWERAADEGAIIDIQADLMRYTVDVTTLFAFGTAANTLEQGDGAIQQHLSQVFASLNRRLAAPFPYWRWFKLPADRRLDRAMVEVREFADQAIAAARQRIVDDPTLAEQPSNLLEGLIVARDEDGSTFSDEEIIGNALTALLAGEDTTANTLAWMIHFLSLSPQQQTDLQQAVDAALGEAPMWRDLDAAGSLKSIDDFMSETLRLKPVAPMIFLCAVEDTVIGDVAIQRGTNLILALRHATRYPGEFTEPQTFDPQRWQSSKRPFALRPPNPFGGGPRMCPGRSLAQMEIKSVISMLLRNFDVEAVDAAAVQEWLSFTLMPRNLKVRLRPR